MKNLWIFGCSFSSPHLPIQIEDTYGYKLAQRLNLELRHFGTSGNSNYKMLHDLIEQLDNIQEEDVLIFQHSVYDRLTFQLDEKKYLHTAGLPQLGVEIKKYQWGFKDFSEKEIQILHDFLVVWQPYLGSILFRSIYNLLLSIYKNKNVKLVNTYLSPEEGKYKLDQTTLVLPLDTNNLNLDICDFLIEKCLTIGDENGKKNDSHPGIAGHNELVDRILQKLKTTYNV